MRNALSMLTALVLLLPCAVSAEDGGSGLPRPDAQPFAGVPASNPPSLFRQIYACEQGTPSFASALGEIPDWKAITVIGRNGKGGALVREVLPNEGFGAGVFRGTSLELEPDLPCAVAKLAVLAPANQVQIVRLSEANRSTAIARVVEYFDARNKEARPDANAEERPSFYVTNYRIESAKAFALTQSYAVVAANVRYDVYQLNMETPLSPKYEQQDPKLYPWPEPTVFVVGRDLTELTGTIRNGSGICDELVSAFRVAKRTYIHVSSNGCANGIKGQMVFDLSGPSPKAVFSDWDLSD